MKTKTEICSIILLILLFNVVNSKYFDEEIKNIEDSAKENYNKASDFVKEALNDSKTKQKKVKKKLLVIYKRQLKL